jgi:hypothetical protein
MSCATAPSRVTNAGNVLVESDITDFMSDRPNGENAASVKWDRSTGTGRAELTGLAGAPSDDDIRRLIERAGRNPEEYVWDIVEIRWNKAAWHRSEAVAADPHPHTAYTAPSCTVKIRILRKAEADDIFVEIRQASPVTINVRSSHRLPKRRQLSGLECAVIFADSQIWYWRDLEGQWHTTHDEAALDLSLQIMADVQAEHGIDTVVDLGDLGDFPNVSTHPSPLAMTLHESTNMTTARISRLMGERTALSPDAKIRRWLRGNHEQRWTTWLAVNASHLVGLRRAGEENIPVLSLQYLTRSAEQGWTLGERSYPNDVFYLTENLRCVHGTIAKAQVGATLNEYLREEINTIAGHTPHAGVAYRTVSRAGKQRTYVACTPGGCMRVDGKVPAMANKNTDWGQPSESDGNNWEQGMAVVFYSTGDLSTVPVIEHIPFFGGKAVWRGKLYEARCDADGNALLKEAA